MKIERQLDQPLLWLQACFFTKAVACDHVVWHMFLTQTFGSANSWLNGQFFTSFFGPSWLTMSWWCLIHTVLWSIVVHLTPLMCESTVWNDDTDINRWGRQIWTGGQGVWYGVSFTLMLSSTLKQLRQLVKCLNQAFLEHPLANPNGVVNLLHMPPVLVRSNQ